jgi:3-hydroxyacyl-[acyl-carrier-protein] dehydratase
MRLTLIDRIVDLESGERITAVKCLSLAEDYLRDHFPRFPIMPGVLMLEAMYQTAAWLVRVTDGFSASLVTLSEANNVKYSDFVEPGETLRVTAELVKRAGSQFYLKCAGEIGDRVAVRGRLVLRTSRLAETDAAAEATDAYIIHSLRRKFQLLYPAGLAETKCLRT